MSIHVNTKHCVVAVPVRADLANLFPGAPRLQTPKGEMLVLPHKPVETKLLQRLGFDVPAPVLSQYDWAGGTPFQIQRETAALLTMNPRAYVLNGMGTGKTRAAIWAFDYLRGKSLAKKMLVVAPLSTLDFTWAKEIFSTTPHLSSVVLYGSREKRLKRLNEEHDIYIINHDGVTGLINELIAKKFDVLLLDELAVYRASQSKRGKIMRKLAHTVPNVWGMTGSPMPNEPTDVWGQAQIVTPTTVSKYFTRFRDEVMVKHGPFTWRARPGATEKAFAALQPAVRFTLDDVTELPELVERTLDVPMGTKQAHIYNEIKKHAYAAIAAKEITAVNAGAVFSKLLQISTGWVYSADKGVVPLDNDARLQALVDAIEGCDRKVIVFVPFVHALDGIIARLRGEGFDCDQVSGRVGQDDRRKIFQLFQNTNRIKVLVAHPQCMAHGLTLTAADTIIWFAPTTSLEIFEQANARVRRVGQKHKQLVLMLQSTEAERKQYARLRAKQRAQNILLEMFEQNS